MRCWIRPALSLVVLCAVAHPARPSELDLRRYVPVVPYRGFSGDFGDEPYTYMDVEDTSVSQASPELNYGRSERLVIRAGSDDKILIAFRQLNRAVTVGSKVTGVELLLYPDGVFDPLTRISLYRVLLPWRDGGSDGKAQPWAATYNDRYAGSGIHRRPWTRAGAGGVGSDRAQTPSASGTLGESWDNDRGAFVLSAPGMTDDLNYWLSKHYRNYGWVIVAEGGQADIRLFSSDILDETRRPLLRLTFKERKVEKPDLPDLDVTYIERTPRYQRYHDNGRMSYERKMFRGDNVGIMKYPDFSDTRKWPDRGEKVTFTAHVKNAGERPLTGPVSYRWTLNDRVVKEGAFTGRLRPWEEWTATFEWAWDVDFSDPRNLVLTFEVDPADEFQEITKNNNLVEKYMGAKTLKYWVEEGTYEYVKDYPTVYGSYSFEDYLQWHFTVWNETYLDKSRFDDIAPDGCLARVALDDFGIVPNGVLQGPIHRPHDKPAFDFDGEWGTTWEIGKGQSKDQEDNFLRFLRSRRLVLESSLLHEASHQTLGAYDIYWSNIEYSEPTDPRGKCKLKDETGYYIPRGDWYIYGGLMGGEDTRPNPQYWEGTGLYACNSVGGFNTNLAYRNGFYGEWQYDLPQECRVRLLSMDGTPLPGAEVSIWQAHSNTIDEQGLVASGLRADSDGLMRLPDQDSLEPKDYTTLTGHTFRARNPFGRYDVVGENITLLVRIDYNGQRDYAFVRTTDFNRGFWAGHKDAYALPLRCRISPAPDIDWDTNVARGAQVTATTGQETAALMVDDDLETAWSGGTTKPGDCIQLDLGGEYTLAAVRLVQKDGSVWFYQRFKIEVSDDPEFGETAQLLAEQAPKPFSIAMSNDKDINYERPSDRWVTYAGKPVSGRYLRITALQGGPAALSEIRVYAKARNPAERSSRG
jgi:hypothetical protein